MRIKLNKKWYLLLGISPIPALIPLFGTISCGSNSTNEIINNPILYDDLPKDYTTQDYKTAINTFRDKVSKMENEEIVTEVNQITQALGKLNNTAYEGLEPFITKEILDNKIDLKTFTFTDQKAQNIYNFFAARISKNFFPTPKQVDELSKQIPDDLDEEQQKQIEERLKNKNLVNLTKSINSMLAFVIVKTEYPIHKLLILANQFLSKNPDPTRWAAGDERNTIGNLICELNFWNNQCGNVFETKNDDKKPWIIPNKDFFKNELDLFEKNINDYEFQNQEFEKRTHVGANEGIGFLLNEKNFIVLFPLAIDKPTIGKINK